MARYYTAKKHLLAALNRAVNSKKPVLADLLLSFSINIVQVLKTRLAFFTEQ
jgi:hypothetical protein